MAKGDFAEATVGCTDLAIGAKWVQVCIGPRIYVPVLFLSLIAKPKTQTLTLSLTLTLTPALTPNP